MGREVSLQPLIAKLMILRGDIDQNIPPQPDTLGRIDHHLITDIKRAAFLRFHILPGTADKTLFHI